MKSNLDHHVDGGNGCGVDLIWQREKNYPIRNPKFTSDKVGAQGGELIDVDSLVPEEVKIVKIEL